MAYTHMLMRQVIFDRHISCVSCGGMMIQCFIDPRNLQPYRFILRYVLYKRHRQYRYFQCMYTLISYLYIFCSCTFFHYRCMIYCILCICNRLAKQRWKLQIGGLGLMFNCKDPFNIILEAFDHQVMEPEFWSARLSWESKGTHEQTPAMPPFLLQD